MNIWNRIWGNIYVKNGLLAVLVIVITVTIVLQCLNVYTRHGKAVVVPDVRGLQEREAALFFKKNGLKYEVVDSVYIKNTRPGSVVEVIPEAGTKVKENRIVYVTINAFSTQTLRTPEVKDLSQRQALAVLHSVGFEQIAIEFVPGLYKDLVVGLQCHGREVAVGEKLPEDTPLTLIVSSGIAETPEDSTAVEELPEESWF
jgi:beta-lactam-binding protein with PASTA domain